MSISVKKWLLAFFLALTLFNLFSVYLLARSGMYNLYIANKAFGLVGMTLLGIVLLIGPLSRLFNLFDGLLKYRKECGIASFAMAFTHGVISRFLIPEVFPASRFALTNAPFLFGLTSLIVLTILFAYSFAAIIDDLDRRQWWKLQYYGVRIAFLLAQLHYVVMKLPEWRAWFAHNSGEEMSITHLPPLGLLVGMFGLTIGAVRVSERLGVKAGRAAVIAFFGFYGVTVSWLFLLR